MFWLFLLMAKGMNIDNIYRKKLLSLLNIAESENMLIREFGFMMMAKILDNQTLQDIEDAYNAAVANSIWLQMKNKYEYFILGTLAWFNGVKSPVQLSMYNLHT